MVAQLLQLGAVDRLEVYDRLFGARIRIIDRIIRWIIVVLVVTGARTGSLISLRSIESEMFD